MLIVPLHSFCMTTTTSAPYDSHRIPEELVYHLPGLSERDKFGNCCLQKHQQANGISASSRFEHDEATLVAIHALFDGNGKQLPCAILPEGTTINDTQFVYDRDIRGHRRFDHHIPNLPCKPVSHEEYPWNLCPYAMKGMGEREVELPEPPDDDLLCLACIALEEFALDVTKPGNVRRSARFAQFLMPISMQWEDLRSDQWLSGVVQCALLRWQDLGFPGFSIARKGMLRGMIQSGAAWSMHTETHTVTESSVGDTASQPVASLTPLQSKNV